MRKGLDPVPALRELEAPELRALLGYAPASEERPLSGRVLVVPVWIGPAVSTLELIDEAGNKSSLAGGVKKGGYWIAGPAPVASGQAVPILIGEGMATMLSAHRATGWVALAALSNGNLPPVAESVREQFPDADIVVLGELGPGEAKARQAADASRARVVSPVFAADARIDDKAPTDFNDMAVLSGLDRVGERLREVVGRDDARVVDGIGSLAGTANGRELDEPMEDMMGNVKEKLVNTGDDTPRRRTSKRDAPKPTTPSEAPEPVTASAEAQPTGERSTAVPAVDTPAAEPRRFAPTRPPVGEPLFAVADVPNEVRALAEHRFGSPLRMGTPRENGGPYRGEVFNTEHYLIQEVATRSVVFHPKTQMEFVSERLRWMDENARLNGSELQVGYEGDRPRVYPWDRARDLLDRTVGSLKKSARELNFSPNLEGMLDQLQARSWARIREARTAALEQSKERSASQDTPGPDR